MYFYIILMFLIGWIIHPIIIKLYSLKTANIIFLLIMFPVCFFAMGFRDVSVGVDTIEYKKVFDDYINYSWHKILTDDTSVDGMEFGFKVFMKVCSDIYPSYYFYQFVFSLIYIFLSFNFIYKNSSNVVLTCAFFLGGGLYMQTFNISRQMLAVIIVGYAVVALLDKKILKSVLIIIIAYLFHSSSIIALIMVLIYPFRNNKYIMTISPILLIAFIILINELLLPLVLLVFEDKYVRYAISEYSIPNFGVFTEVVWIVTLILAVVAYYSPWVKNSSTKFLAWLSFVAVACFWVGLSIRYVDRMGLYFLPCILLLYDRIAKSIDKKVTREAYINGLTGFYILYFCYWTYTNEAVSYNIITN